jgi:hypothetical protein
MQESHTRTLAHLLQWKGELSILIAALQIYPRDVSVPLITLQRHHVESVLIRFLRGAVDTLQVEAWANAIEGNEAITLEPSQETWLNEVIFILANPLLTEPLTPKIANTMLST